MPSGRTPKQEAFVRAYLKSGNASEAYRKAYNCVKAKDSTVHRSAKALLDHPKIAPSILAARDQAAKHTGLTLEQHLKSLSELRDEARLDGQYSAAVSAEVARGKAAGLLVEKHQHELGPSFEDLVRASLLKPEGT